MSPPSFCFLTQAPMSSVIASETQQMSLIAYGVLCEHMGAALAQQWTAGRQMKRSFLHLGFDSYRKFMPVSQVVPGPV